MLTVSAAQALVLGHARPLPPESTPLTPSSSAPSLRRMCAATSTCRRIDKSMMDGYAVRTADLPLGRGDLAVVEEVMAGQTPRLAVSEGQATRHYDRAPRCRAAPTPWSWSSTRGRPTTAASTSTTPH